MRTTAILAWAGAAMRKMVLWFMVLLSLLQSHRASASGLPNEHRTAQRDPQTKPTDLGCESACRLL